VVARLEDLHFLVLGPVHEAVLVIDAARPVAGKVALQGLRLAYPGERVTLRTYSPARAWSSSMVLTTVAWPDLSLATASMSRLALAGDRSR